MREFGAPISSERFKAITSLAANLFADLPNKRLIHGEALSMDDPEMIVLETAEVLDQDGNKFKLSATKPEACPPFEWLYEISSDLGHSEYFRHYLIRDTDIVLAQPKISAELRLSS